MAVESQAMVRFGWRVHALLPHLTGGRIGSKFRGMPVLVLSTMGRKSGKNVHNPVDVRPRWRRPHHRRVEWRRVARSRLVAEPRAHPHTSIEVGGRALPVMAERLDVVERNRLWPALTKRYAGYAEYERMAKRAIPVIRLHPSA